MDGRDTAPDLAARRAGLAPDRTAFVDHGTGRDWTFGQVNEAADRLARGLIAQGFRPGQRLGVLSLNRAEFFVALFAAQKSGLILCPLNWRQPAAELAPVAAMVDCRAVIHDAAQSALAATLNLPCFAMDDLPALDGPALPPHRKGWDEPWYLLFTSGTTGLPKAVIQTPRMALSSATNLSQALGLSAHDRTPCFLPNFHTAGINIYAMAVFLWGGITDILPRFSPDDLLELIAAGQVTQFFGMPAIYQAFSMHPGIDAAGLDRVRAFGCGGAPLAAPLIRFFADRGAIIRNGYGMTESGPSGFLIDEQAAITRIGSVGRPPLLTEARIDGLPDASPGEGELLLRGATITPGYFGDPKATAAAFTPDGWLRTGDVAARDTDGYYRIVDRIKDMYISGGENVYPAEVERVLAEHPAVLEVAVIGVPDPRWGEVGAAHLVPRPGQTPDPDSIAGWLRERIAAYKIPRHWRVVADLPRTAGGKVRKPDLRAGFR
jgi:fatty-acyl-CoA synthase